MKQLKTIVLLIFIVNSSIAQVCHEIGKHGLEAGCEEDQICVKSNDNQEGNCLNLVKFDSRCEHEAQCYSVDTNRDCLFSDYWEYNTCQCKDGFKMDNEKLICLDVNQCKKDTDCQD